MIPKNSKVSKVQKKSMVSKVPKIQEYSLSLKVNDSTASE
jgi:hypothetical protein